MLSPAVNRARLVDLKARGHEVIDALVEDGVSREGVYMRLAHRLEIPLKQAHFASVRTIGQAEARIAELDRWLACRQKGRADEALATLEKQMTPLDKKQRRKRDMLPQLKMKEAFEELDRVRSTYPLLQRIKKHNENPNRQRTHTTPHPRTRECGLLRYLAALLRFARLWR